MEIHPRIWERLELRRALAARDISTVYRLLIREGVTRSRISELTGQCLSEVSAIASGRQVQKVPLLEQIADGLGIPRGYMGIAYSETPTYGDQGRDDASTGDEVDEDVKRRAFLAAATTAVVGRPVLGEALALASPAADPAVPTRIARADVAALRDLTERLRGLGRAFGGMFDTIGPVAGKADRLLGASSEPHVARSLRQALADLHELSGWTAYDVGLVDRARYHYDRAMRLAGEAGDPLRMVSAVEHASYIDREGGSPDTALKLLQLAIGKLLRLPTGNPEALTQLCRLYVQAARCHALMGRADFAKKELTQSRDFPVPEDRFARAELDGLKARIAVDLGDLTAAHQYALTSVQTWDESDRRDSALSRITLAVAHVTAGERDAPNLTGKALEAVQPLQSVRLRARLVPLEQALRRRTDSTSVDLAEHAAQLRRETPV